MATLHAKYLYLQPASSAIVNLVVSGNHYCDVVAEDVRPFRKLDFRAMTFSLPDNLASATCSVEIESPAQMNNAGTI